MSYVNRSTRNARSGTIAAVAALHVGAAIALINGLGMDYVKEQVFNLPTTNYPAQPKIDPPPPPPEPEKAEPSPKHQPQITPADPMVGKSGPLVFSLPPLEPPALPDAEPFVPRPSPSFEPGPRFEPVGAKPKGRPGLWVTSNDYPTRDIREGNEGTVTFRLLLDASGKPRDCEILRGSGHPGLDAATCDKLIRRASFEPARDGSGERVASSYTGTVRWVIPE
ncbi:MAG: energy transducer TonB [Novosphingobium sp.]|nr:energy transducer TonB [Novosphingobium sp.]